MAAIIDNLIAYRVLSMIVKPFRETNAYKLGVIDENGKILIKPSDRTAEQKENMTYLHRLCFNLKKLLNKLPGGDSKLKNIVAAFFLIRESYVNRISNVEEHSLRSVVSLMDRGVVLAEDQLIVEDFLLAEDMAGGIANVTGSGVSTDTPVIRKPKRFAKFNVSRDVFDKFPSGKTNSRTAKQYLNTEESLRVACQFIKSNPHAAISISNGNSSKFIKFYD